MTTDITEQAKLRAELSNPAVGSKDHLRKLALSLVDALEKAQQRIIQLESRTVTVKFTPIPVEELGNLSDGKKHPYMFGAGYNSAVIHCESVIQQELDANGIKWEAK